MKILVADGNLVFLDHAQSFFWNEGHDAEIAADGLECVSLLEAYKPDVLVLDHDLLWGGSAGVLDRLHRLPQLGMVPVILMLHERRQRDLQVFEHARVVKHFYKPLQMRELLQAVETHGRPRRLHFVPVGPI